MMLFYVALIGCFLHFSSSTPLEASKGTPLDLAHTCMHIQQEKAGELQHQNDTPIILLHGLGSSKESWAGVYQVLALRTGRRVCIVDLRNHGDSPWHEEFDIEAIASDLPHLLDTLKMPKAIILGHSLGGKTAIHFAMKHPSRVEKLIVEDMRPNGAPPEALTMVKFFMQLLLKAIAIVPENSTEKEAKKIVAKFLMESLTKVNDTDIFDERAADFLPIKCTKGKCAWKTNTKLFKVVMEDPLRFLTTSSGRFDGPTLFIYGSKSPFKVHEAESSIKELFPKANLVQVLGAGHLVHSFPEFLNTVIKFINSSE